jgi:hypothetical protein
MRNLKALTSSSMLEKPFPGREDEVIKEKDECRNMWSYFTSEHNSRHNVSDLVLCFPV